VNSRCCDLKGSIGLCDGRNVSIKSICFWGAENITRTIDGPPKRAVRLTTGRPRKRSALEPLHRGEGGKKRRDTEAR